MTAVFRNGFWRSIRIRARALIVELSSVWEVVEIVIPGARGDGDRRYLRAVPDDRRPRGLAAEWIQFF